MRDNDGGKCAGKGQASPDVFLEPDIRIVADTADLAPAQCVRWARSTEKWRRDQVFLHRDAPLVEALIRVYGNRWPSASDDDLRGYVAPIVARQIIDWARDPSYAEYFRVDPKTVVEALATTVLVGRVLDESAAE